LGVLVETDNYLTTSSCACDECRKVRAEVGLAGSLHEVRLRPGTFLLLTTIGDFLQLSVGVKWIDV
jgi:hypothetical protein